MRVYLVKTGAGPLLMATVESGGMIGDVAVVVGPGESAWGRTHEGWMDLDEGEYEVESAAFADDDMAGPIADREIDDALALIRSIDPAGLFEPNELLAALADHTAETLKADADRLLADLAPADFAAFGASEAIGRFFKRAARTLRAAYLAAALAVVGPTLDADAREAVGVEMAKQGAYLRAFEESVRDGGQPPDGTLPARAALYGMAAWSVGMGVHRSIVPGDEERRILDGEMHCPECPPLAAMGWQPRGTLPAIGDTVCRTNCRCYWEFR